MTGLGNFFHPVVRAVSLLPVFTRKQIGFERQRFFVLAEAVGVCDASDFCVKTSIPMALTSVPTGRHVVATSWMLKKGRHLLVGFK